ncbi:holocytochrome c synthase [Tulasnella sp. JGI-2019a]|nr:holocytochrome c synthase [Tulasnella sp. JGI-2019a]
MGQTASQIPASHPSVPLGDAGSPPPGCPMHKSAAATLPPAPVQAAPPPAKCPVSHDQINPLNQMPSLSQAPAPSQAIALPTERVISSIPRPATPEEPAVGPSKWEYPSPQQFYNALVRKGWETPEEHVETMVEIHNFLNEEAWNEVCKWEQRWNKESYQEPELARLHGKPGELSPKARIHLFAGWLFPSRFSSEAPFDRHDWVVRRPSTGEEVRYIIDYYSAPDEPDGSPVFSLDVRPALDSPGSIVQRISAATTEVWSSFRSGKMGDQ